MTFGPGRTRALIGALPVAGTLAAAPLAHAATYTWTGAASAAANSGSNYCLDENWSDARNWASGVAATAGATGSFAFPGTVCPATFATCFGGSNDLAGVTADGLTISSDGGYEITNPGPSDSMVLEQTGQGDALDAVNDAPGTTGTTRFYVPMTLVGNQTWTIDGNGSGIGNGLTLGNTVTGGRAERSAGRT